MDGLIPLLRVTPATEVAKKWNVTRKRLNEIVEKIRIPLYSVCEKRISPKDGKTVYFCQGPYFSFYHEGPIDNEYYVLEGIYFDTGSIESYENAHPEILWEPADQEFILEKEYGENIPADVIRKLLKMSPIRFIELMNNREGPLCSLEEDFKRYRENLYSSEDFFSISDLENGRFTFHILDWKAWKEARDARGKNNDVIGKASLDNSDVLYKDLQKKDAEVLRLKQECAEKQKTIQDLEAQLAARPPVTNKTTSASVAKQENALAAWKPVIPAMLEVYHQCLAEGPTQRTKKDLERFFTRQGVELTQAQMAFFRDCLPEGHVNKTGGAPVQKT